MRIKTLSLLLTLSMLVLPVFATADCLITADITAEMTNNELGAYMYTMDFSWDMDSQYGLSHFNLMVDAVGGTCSCSDISSTIFFGSVAGYSDGEGGCMVDYIATLECEGDPSIPGVEGILFKMEPIEGECEPGNTGSGTMIFYSNLGPVPVDEEYMALTDKAAHVYCAGTISGVFPGLACDPVASETLSWDGIKGIYR